MSNKKQERDEQNRTASEARNPDAEKDVRESESFTIPKKVRQKKEFKKKKEESKPLPGWGASPLCRW